MRWGADDQLMRSAQDEVLRQAQAREFRARMSPPQKPTPSPVPETPPVEMETAEWTAK